MQDVCRLEAQECWSVADAEILRFDQQTQELGGVPECVDALLAGFDPASQSDLRVLKLDLVLDFAAEDPGFAGHGEEGSDGCQASECQAVVGEVCDEVLLLVQDSMELVEGLELCR